jgi:glycosyltransferase involved in cell wall biosynthesis
MKTLQIGMGWFQEQAGGLNRVYADCLHYLPKVGVEFSGLVAASEQVSNLSAGQVCAFASKDAPLLARWRGIRAQMHEQLHRQPYDLVASHFALYTLPVLNQIGDRPLVVHFHGPWALEGDVEGSRAIATWAKKQIEQLPYRRANQFIVLSKAFQDILHRDYGIPLERIHIVPGGVDLERFALPQLTPTQARAALGWHPDRPIIFIVRRLAKRMGLENAIAAMQQVRQQHPDALLLIAGKGELQDTLQTQIQTLGLGEQVKLLGYLPDEQLPLAYRAATFSMVPTVALEGFGLIVIESLAAGTPVLGTPVGGIPEILRPLSEHLVLESSAPEHLAQGMSQALSGQRPLPDAVTCQAYATQHYAWPVVAQQIKAVYEQALAGAAA